VSEAMLRDRLQEALATERGAAPAIAGLTRATANGSSSYRTELLTLELADGAELQVFLKDFGTSTHRKDGMRARRQRELSVYRELLAGADLGTPRYLGAVWDEPAGRYWLLLEHVEGQSLRRFGFGHWLEAARWLGRLQGHAARIDLARAGFLVDHDAGFFASAAARALHAVRAVSPPLGARLAGALRDYDELVALMAAEPRTLVHGHFRPHNIVVRPGEVVRSLCVIDWEESACGSPLYDLAYLSDGFDPPRLGRLLDGYEEEAGRSGLPARDRDQALRVLHCLYMHRNLKTLTKVQGDGFTPEGIEGLVGSTVALAGRVA
jgi:aminoglycoside phosphotransferase (APT) family kinase protein